MEEVISGDAEFHENRVFLCSKEREFSRHAAVDFFPSNEFPVQRTPEILECPPHDYCRLSYKIRQEDVVPM